MTTEEKLAHQRSCVEKEIIDTEIAFAKDLTILKRLRSILQDKKLLPDQVLGEIFLNIDSLFQLSTVLTEQLQLGTKSIGEVYLAQAPYLKVFSVYCGGHEAALATWKKYKSKSKSGLMAFDDLVAQNYQGLYLHDYLIKPVQRICKYPLLFRSLIECIPAGTPYHKIVDELFGAVNSIVGHINSEKAKAENIIAMKTYSEIIVDQPPTFNLFDRPGRKFLREVFPSWVIIMKRTQVAGLMKSDDPQFERCLLLFDDKLVVTQKKEKKESKQLIFRRELQLIDLTIMDTEPSFRFHEKSIMIEDTARKDDFTFLFLFSKPADKKAFFKDIKRYSTEARLESAKKNQPPPLAAPSPSSTPASSFATPQIAKAPEAEKTITLQPLGELPLDVDYSAVQQQQVQQQPASHSPNQLSPSGQRVVVLRPSRGRGNVVRGGARGGMVRGRVKKPQQPRATSFYYPSQSTEQANFYDQINTQGADHVAGQNVPYEQQQQQQNYYQPYDQGQVPYYEPNYDNPQQSTDPVFDQYNQA